MEKVHRQQLMVMNTSTVHIMSTTKYVLHWGFSVFRGEFKENFMDGHGKMVYSDGSVYEGTWKLNQVCQHRETKYYTTCRHNTY